MQSDPVVTSRINRWDLRNRGVESGGYNNYSVRELSRHDNLRCIVSVAINNRNHRFACLHTVVVEWLICKCVLDDRTKNIFTNTYKINKEIPS